MHNVALSRGQLRHEAVNHAACHRFAIAHNAHTESYLRGYFLIETLNRQCVLDYLQACYAGDIERASSFYDDDIDFVAYAPIEIFPTLGQKRGKAELTQSLVGLHQRYSKFDYEVLSIIAEEDRVATLLDLGLHARDSGRVIRLQIGNFCTLRQGRFLIYRQFLDSFDAAQQKLQRDIVASMADRP
jgi:ketosteroid isomerase-like protein